MITTHKILGVTAVSILMILTAFLMFSTPASANPSTIQRDMGAGCGVGVATTSVTYLNATTATTTAVFDTQCGTSAAVDSTAFLLQFTGSSTASILNVAFEYSPGISGFDCRVTPTVCDWYADTTFANTNATTTQSFSIATPNSFRLPFASTTVGGAVGSAARTTRGMTVPSVARYIRAVITLIPGSLNGAVWYEFDAKKQNP